MSTPINIYLKMKEETDRLNKELNRLKEENAELKREKEHYINTLLERGK